MEYQIAVSKDGGTVTYDIKTAPLQGCRLDIVNVLGELVSAARVPEPGYPRPANHSGGYNRGPVATPAGHFVATYAP
jgi:hypothetical protein